MYVKKYEYIFNSYNNVDLKYCMFQKLMIEGYYYILVSICYMNIDKIKQKENYNYVIRINEI